MTRLINIAALLCLTWLTVAAQSSQPAPSLSLKTIEGRAFHLSDYKGKVVLLNFWATWCPPCRQEIPELIKLQREFRGQGLQIIGITFPPEKTSRVSRFAHRTRMNYPIVIGTKQTKLMFAENETLPMTVVLDSNGHLRDVIEGIIFRDEFDEKVKPLLSPAPAKPVVVNDRRRAPQRRTIIVNRDGYRPAAIKLRNGVKARLVFIRKTDEGCGTEIVIPAYGINRALPLNQPVAVEFTPKKSGRFKMTCGMDMFRGAIVVR